jgi:hypothetical protein
LIEARVAETETLAAPVLATATVHAPGERVGPYVLVEILGTGGMARYGSRAGMTARSAGTSP